MLKVQLLNPNAIVPTVAHPGEDLGFDLYALEPVHLTAGVVRAVSTGIAARFELPHAIFPMTQRKFGLLIKDRSSMAAKGIKVSAGVIDAGYTGELKVLMTATRESHLINAGDKIAQMLPQEIFTRAAIGVVTDLGKTTRGEGGFGSTGT